MNKGTKKNPKYNPKALEVIFTKYGLSEYYIRQCINGSKKGLTPDAIKKDYKEACTVLGKAEQEVVNNLLSKN